jgi:hypothetical protein
VSIRRNVNTATSILTWRAEVRTAIRALAEEEEEGTEDDDSEVVESESSIATTTFETEASCNSREK